MKSHLIFSIILISIFIKNAICLEITVPINLYKPLSKTNETSMIGSSNIIIDSKEIKQNSNLPLQNILDLKTGIKSRSIYGSNYSGSKSTIDIICILKYIISIVDLKIY